MSPPGKPPLSVVPPPSERELAMRPGGLAMVCSPAEAQRRLQEMQGFVQTAMVAGIDFMIVPGTSDKKPSLLQPGAQKLAEIYGFAHRFLVTEEQKDWERGFFYFAVKCQLTSRADGSFVGEGIGSCNSRESKYSQRWAFASEVPAHLNAGSLPRRTKTARNGKEYDVFAVPNEDPYSLINTLQKMAAKRSYVHAVLSVTRSSGLFTQDREDVTLPPDVYGVVEEQRPWEREPPPAYVPPPPAYVAPEQPKAPEPPPNAAAAPSNAYTASELKAQRELDPAVDAATTKEEVELLRREAVLACGGKPPTPRYFAWYQAKFRAAQIRVGS